MRILVLMSVAALALAACGGEQEPDAGETEPPAAGAGAAAEREKPAVEIPDGDPPSDLQVEDLIVGEGPSAEPGARVYVHYVGVLWDGTQFDASWDRGQPVEFSLDGVVPGFAQGISGEGVEEGPMRVGGRRRIVIPPELGYGERGAGEAIPPGSTLVFVVDLLDLPDST